MPDRINSQILELLGAARSHFQYLRELGLERLATPPAQESLVPCPVGVVDLSSVGPCRSETLEELESFLAGCQRCPLGQTRTRLVFGTGNPAPRLVFVGEAPGREEDLRGEPFVGEAGQLLDRILAAMEMCREEVYICNLLKCRPPANRDPEPEEIATCEPFLVRQLAALQPRAIVALGRFAVQSLLKTRVPISRLRGQWHTYQGIRLMPTYHPAYLLRNPQDKKKVWEDMKEVRRWLLDASGGD